MTQACVQSLRAWKIEIAGMDQKSKDVTRITRTGSKATDFMERKKNSFSAKRVAALLDAIRGFAACPSNPC
jgi:hypothetical protein